MFGSTHHAAYCLLDFHSDSELIQFYGADHSSDKNFDRNLECATARSLSTMQMTKSGPMSSVIRNHLNRQHECPVKDYGATIERSPTLAHLRLIRR